MRLIGSFVPIQSAIGDPLPPKGREHSRLFYKNFIFAKTVNEMTQIISKTAILKSIEKGYQEIKKAENERSQMPLLNDLIAELQEADKKGTPKDA